VVTTTPKKTNNTGILDRILEHHDLGPGARDCTARGDAQSLPLAQLRRFPIASPDLTNDAERRRGIAGHNRKPIDSRAVEGRLIFSRLDVFAQHPTESLIQRTRNHIAGHNLIA